MDTWWAGGWMGGRRYHLPRHCAETCQPGARCDRIACIRSRYQAPKRYTAAAMRVCIGDRGRCSPKSYLPGSILICPGAHGAQSLRGSAPEGVFVHSSIDVSCPLALRARRFHGVRPRGGCVLFSNSCSVSPGAWSAQALAPEG